jgi:3-hydroxybutyryl-CoA dehydrogenase
VLAEAREEAVLDWVGKVGVVGCGTMGSGIAEVAARAGYRVVVREPSQELLEKGLERIRASAARAEKRGKITAEERQALLERLEGTTELEAMAGCGVVVEAVPEDVQLKKGLLRDLDRVLGPEALLATNTSSISITALAAATSRPERVVGLHFFNPAPVMALVEVVKGLLTSEAVVERAKSFAEDLGKTPVVVGDSPGFLVNALLVPFLNQAVRMVERGYASPEDVDRAMTLGAGHPMGPFALLDLIGIDVALSVQEVLFRETGDPSLAPAGLMKRMVAAGLLGRKTGKGFYLYPREGGGR